MFYGKARFILSWEGKPIYFTRKDRRHIVEWHSCNPGKKNKQCYNRQLRNGKWKLYPFKNSQWKKAQCTDPWQWC